MHKIRLFLTLLLISCPLILSAQGDRINVGLRTGHNTAFGGFAAVSVEATQTLFGNLAVNGGLQYNTIGKTSIEARPTYGIPLKRGRISVECLLTYTNLSSINNFTAGAGATLDSKYLSFRCGYYYRLYCNQGGKIKEPFNIYYELRAHLLQKIDKWNLDLVITTCETFELERHYQPSYIAEASFNPTSRFGISFGIGCKPSGAFNMSADYYQSYLKTGVCYRW